MKCACEVFKESEERTKGFGFRNGTEMMIVTQGFSLYGLTH
jgi:hypothetical protein